MLFLNKREISRIFRMKDAIAAYIKAFRIYSQGGSEVPLRVNIAAPKYDGRLLFMPGYVERLDCAGVKIVSVFPRNRELGKLSVPSTMALLDATSGEVSAILDGTYLTQLRTGAATGAATRCLAREDAKIGALIGCGGQALAQLEAMLEVRDFDEIRVCGRNYQHAVDFVKEAGVLFGGRTELIPVAEASLAIRDADVVTAVTTSLEPVFDGRELKAGAHVNAIGSYLPQMQEIDAVTLQRAAKVFCESKEAALAESGDFIIPLAEGLINEDKISGEIGALFLGALQGRESAEEITLFKSVGMAVVDIVTAQEIYHAARKEKCGIELEF